MKGKKEQVGANMRMSSMMNGIKNNNEKKRKKNINEILAMEIQRKHF